jgi:hypothetical protein
MICSPLMSIEMVNYPSVLTFITIISQYVNKMKSSSLNLPKPSVCTIRNRTRVWWPINCSLWNYIIVSMVNVVNVIHYLIDSCHWWYKKSKSEVWFVIGSLRYNYTIWIINFNHIYCSSFCIETILVFHMSVLLLHHLATPFS